MSNPRESKGDSPMRKRMGRRRKKVCVFCADAANNAIDYKDVNKLKLVDIINLLSQRPTEQKQLATAHDKLKEVVGQMTRVNEQNKELIRQSLEMVEFDLNLIQAMKSAPQTANYTRGAYNTGAVMGRSNGGFDAKQ